MPQTRGNISWETNKRVCIPERKIRTTSLGKCLENITISHSSKAKKDVLQNDIYKCRVDLNEEIKKEKREANQIFQQLEMIKEVGDTWKSILQTRKSVNETLLQKNDRSKLTKSRRIKSGVIPASFKQTSANIQNPSSPLLSVSTPNISVGKLRERSNSRFYLETYSRSYRYLRDLVALDKISKDRYQVYYDWCITEKKRKYEEKEGELNNRIKDFNESVNDFVKKANHSDSENALSSQQFMKKLIMPNFAILMD